MRDGPRRFSRDSTCPAILRNLPSEPARFRLRGSHPPWPVVPDRSTSALVCDSPTLRSGRPYNPAVHARRFGLFRVRSPLLAESLLFSVPAGTEMVHFPALSSMAYVFSHGYLGINRGGFPHSEISGSTPVCGSPKLIAACHVLHRLLAPRHPPYALSSLTFNPRNRCRPALRAGINPRMKSTTPPDRLTHCVCGRKKLPFAGYSVVKEPPDGTRRGSRLSGRRPSPNSAEPTAADLVSAGRRAPAGAVLVENTGLEPVTSWLQTKRSPS